MRANSFLPWFLPLQVCCLFCCRVTSQKQFSSLSDVTEALRKVNIDLVNSRLHSSGFQHGDATIAGVKVSLAFPWPLDKNGTMQLPSNQRLPIPDVRDFARQLWRQVGINGLLPPLQLVGIGNYGLSVETFRLSFKAGNVSAVQIVFNIPGRDALHQLKFKIVQPKLNIDLDFLRRQANVKAKGFLVSLNYVESRLKNRGLPIELIFPDDLGGSMETTVADKSAVVEFNSLMPLLSSFLNTKSLEAIRRISQNITVPMLHLRLAAGLSNISIVNVTMVSTRPFLVLGKVTISTATLELTENGNSFHATINVCGQDISVNMRNDTSGDYLILEAAEEEKQRTASITLDTFLSCFEDLKEHRPDINFMRMNNSSYSFGLKQFRIRYKMSPNLQLADIIVLFQLPSEWNVFKGAFLSTQLLNSTLSAKITLSRHNSLADIKAEIFGQAIIGHPPFIEFPFLIEVPTKASPISLTLQGTKTISVDFKTLSKLGILSGAFPSFLSTLLTQLLITKLKLEFSSVLTGAFKTTTLHIETPPKTVWNFPFFYLENIKIFHTVNHTLVSGEINLGNVSLPCQLDWPPTGGDPVIELRNSAMVGVSSFVQQVYRTFFGREKIKDIVRGLKRSKLSFISSFTLKKASFHLSRNLSFEKASFKGAIGKYSWELLNDFFGVRDISVSIDIDVGPSFALFIEGTIVLVEGSVSMPFQLNVPFSKNQSLEISLPENARPRISFRNLSGILFSASGSNFPSSLGSYLPELVLQKQIISFDEKLTVFEINTLQAVRTTPWDLGGIGALTIWNVTVSMSPHQFTLRGSLSIGNTVLVLKLTNSSDGQVFSLVRPIEVKGLNDLITDALKKMLPGVKSLPDVDLLGLNVADRSSVQFAKVQFSNNFDFLQSFALKIRLSNSWSFFQSTFSLLAPTMNLHVDDLSDIPSYKLDISGTIEFVNGKNRIVFPLECNIPESPNSMITLKLQQEVVFNLSNIAALPLVGKLIPPSLLAPISDIIGDVQLWPLSADFEPTTARLESLNLTVTALKHWKLKGFPLVFQNITLEFRAGQKVYATLQAIVVLNAKPIFVRMPFPPDIPNMPELKLTFPGFPETTLAEIGLQLVGGFGLEGLFPPVFDKLKISMKLLNLRLLQPLRQLRIQSFRMSFSLKDQVTIIDNWLRISDITADLSVATANKVSVAGRLACLMTFGKGANVLQIHGVLLMPHYSFQAWELDILPQQTDLSAANIVELTGGGFDLKALFPDDILSKADKFLLKHFKAAFNPNPRFQIFNITCALEANLSDVSLPLGIRIQRIYIKLFIEDAFTAKQSVKITIYVLISLGKAVVETFLTVYKDSVVLAIENLKEQPLTLSDLATLIGGDQLLNIVPGAFLNFNKVNSLSISFSKPQFDVLNATVRYDINGFDVGFSFPLPVPDPSNNFKARLAVQYLTLDLKQSKDWELSAAIKASFTGIPLQKHFSDLEGLVTVTSRSAILTLKKKLLDTKVDMKLAGIDCNLNIKFSDPEIIFVTPRQPKIKVTLEVTGFDVLNKMFPFKVFKDTLNMYVVITEETGISIQLETMPIRDELIPCKKDNELYTCDFTWLCEEHSYVRFKLPSLAYTRDGFSAIIDVQGLDTLCVPITLPLLRQFFKNIPFLFNLAKSNIPLWPPPDIIGNLNRMGCNIDNLPKGMQRFKSPEFPREITLALSMSPNGPLTLSLEVQNGESLDVAMPVSPLGDLLAVSFRRFSIGTIFGLPFVDIDAEVYLWDLKFVILLSRLPRQTPLLINAANMETHIICKDCFFVILGFLPIPIFAAPLSVKYSTLIDIQAQLTIYHRRPDFKDLGAIASLLVGLVKYYTTKDYLLSMDDVKAANSSLLVLKLSHENDLTMIQLPAFSGGSKLTLNVPPIDGKKFLIGWMNFMKTFEPIWLLQIVPLKYRILDVAFNIGPFRWSLLKFAASSPEELKKNKALWPYPVMESGDDALIMASADLVLLSADVVLRVKNFGNAGLSIRLNAGISRVVKISFEAAAQINLEDSSNPMLISAKAHLKLFDVPLLRGEVTVTKDMIVVFGELKFNFLGVVKLGGRVRAVFGPGLVFALDAAIDLQFVGVTLSSGHIYIKESPSSSLVRASSRFMGSKLNIVIRRRGLSIAIEAQAKIAVGLRVDLGKIKVFGRDLGRIVLSTGFDCEVRISFPGRSTLKVSFHFLGQKIDLPSLTINIQDARPERIPPLLLDYVKNKAPTLIKDLFQKDLRLLLKAFIEGLTNFVGNAGEFVKDLLKMGLKVGGELIKDVGRFLKNLADSTKALAQAAEQAVKAAAQAAKAVREVATKAVEAAKKAVEQVSKVAEKVKRQFKEAGKALIQATGKVIRLKNAVKEAERVFKNISKTLEKVVNRISQIAQKIADEIAKGLRNLAGKVIKTVKGWFGKRSIYRRDALTDEKRNKERAKKNLQKDQSNQKTRVRQKERELESAQKREQIKKALYEVARKEALRSTENLKKTLKDKTDKVAHLDDILKKGKCVTGEHNCHPSATCIRSGQEGQSFKCICRRGWVGDGVFCERPIKSVAVISDSPKAVGEAVSFSSFILSGTNAKYRYSFNRAFSEYGVASHTFNSSGVHVVNVFAKNNVSSVSASEIVIVQVPVSNFKLQISGDRRVCRAVNLNPSASGTNVSFTIDFGDNTSLANVRGLVRHHYRQSGEFIINVTAWNFVSSISETFFVNISSTPCDRLYCDMWLLERAFPGKKLTEITSLAWFLQQPSLFGNREIRLNKIWKYLALMYPLSYSVFEKASEEIKLGDRRSQYIFGGTYIEIDAILAGILASSLALPSGNKRLPFLPHISKPLETFTWIASVLIDTTDFLSTWNISVESTTFCQDRLSTSTVNSALDGYVLGLAITNSSGSEKLSNVLFDYYCPTKNDVKYSWKTRYQVFYNVFKSMKNGEPLAMVVNSSLLFNHIASRENFVSPIRSLCLGYFWSVTRPILKNPDDKVNKSVEFLDSTYPYACNLNQHCSQCVLQPGCGWCKGEKSGFCTAGLSRGPTSTASCRPTEWYHGTCTSTCPLRHGRFCSANGICESGRCNCFLGFHGKDCSKRGCVYKTKQNDTLQTISVWSHVDVVNIQKANSGRLRLFTRAVNSLVTVPMSNQNYKCINDTEMSKFHSVFPRMLRLSRNKAGLNSFCGLFESIAPESESPSACKGLTSRGRCLESGKCSWNIREPCSGMILEGCFKLTHWIDLLVQKSDVIYSPIPGNVKIEKDAIKITGWPQSLWEGYTVTISHLRPYNITSVQSGQKIGKTLPQVSILPAFVSVQVIHDGVYKDPMAFLLPCSPGCSQVLHFYNGLCDQACNTDACNHDNGECLSIYFNQSDYALEPMSFHDLYSPASLRTLFHLQKITGEKSLEVARGPLSVFSIAKWIVVETLNTSDFYSYLVYRSQRSRLIKFINPLIALNTSLEKMTLLTAQKLIELGVHNVSPYSRCSSDYDIVDIKTSSLRNQTNFQIGLNKLMSAQIVDMTLGSNYRQSQEPYLHLVIPRNAVSYRWLNHFDITLNVESTCDSLTSCSGHGICFTNGSCKCDNFYMGRKCQFNTCPGRCYGHGTCIEGVCVCSVGWDGDDCSKVKFCTPLCPEAWIGDSVCDPDCNTPKCNGDKGDCQDVCICPKSWLSDGACDHMCNNSNCGYDGGDCVEEECSSGCRSQMLGDGICDHQCNTEICDRDKGDCESLPICPCSSVLQGNGMCDDKCNILECMYDYGDCTFQIVEGSCPQACSPPMIGNGFCDLSCNLSACNFDGGDCTISTSSIDSCSEGCLPTFRGDGVCDSVCNLQACGFDDGDCPKTAEQECAPECEVDMVGDGTCQQQCQVEECSFDATDCMCAPGCLNSTLGDGICNIDCFVEPCNYDGNDCMCPPENCPKHLIGNGHCDVACNSKICDFDGGDCTCSAGCTITSIRDGSCDPACDSKLCHFDGLDCGGCESESHLNICDENAHCVVDNRSLPFVRCQCNRGFYGDGFSCVKRGNCFNGSDVCSRNGRCVDSNGTFECYCNPGWVGNGVFCENVDECKEQNHNCNIHANCIDVAGTYNCNCEAGWSGDGYNCTDINECKMNSNSCCANEDCVNSEGNYSCECKDGWRKSENSSLSISERCTSNHINPLCVEVDECADETHNCSSQNGQANALCTNTIGSFQCTCTQGWQGDGFYCNDINECANGSVCGDNQFCINTVGNYSCSCLEGFTSTGPSNEDCKDVDECVLGLDDCDMFATCINTKGSFTCECMPGFEDKGRICTKYQCGDETNNVTRSTEKNGTIALQQVCSCIGQYINTGRTCTDIDECERGSFVCPSFAPVCQNLIGGYECKCDAVDNSSCDAVNPCDSANNTCKENMSCISIGMDHYCVCPEGYTENQNGTACIDVNECDSLQFYGSCDSNADCVNVDGSYDCKCHHGFFQSGDACFEVDECKGMITQTVEGQLEECRAGVCASTQTCVYYNSSIAEGKAVNFTFICACDESDNRKIDCVETITEVVQTGDNVTTVISIPWYSVVNGSSHTIPTYQSTFMHNCTDKAMCKNLAGSYQCICLHGYKIDDGGWSCHDIDECLENNTCHPNATCLNKEGSFDCKCKPGFAGDGPTNCSDIDECSFVNCTKNSFCRNIVGGYVCDCLDGFHKNGSVCEDVDECSKNTLNECHPRSSCYNYIGGYNCSCFTGYYGDGFRCSDVNECRESSILCGDHASCYNTLGSYKCTCDPGWTGDGQNCTNIDECALGLHMCIENSYCTDNEGSYTCSCHRGWKRQWFEPYGRCSMCDANTFCSGHGQCLRNGLCDCLSHYSGRNCSVCNPNVRCSGHGFCDFNGTCHCEYGWTRRPLDCSICFSAELCSGHGLCNDNLLTYKEQPCFCDDRYFGYNCSTGKYRYFPVLYFTAGCICISICIYVIFSPLRIDYKHLALI